MQFNLGVKDSVYLELQIDSKSIFKKKTLKNICKKPITKITNYNSHKFHIYSLSSSNSNYTYIKNGIKGIGEWRLLWYGFKHLGLMVYFTIFGGNRIHTLFIWLVHSSGAESNFRPKDHFFLGPSKNPVLR